MTKFNFLKTACVLCLMALFSLSINAQNRTMIGDVDGSGDLEIVDATFIQRWLAEFNVQFPIGQKIMQ